MTQAPWKIEVPALHDLLQQGKEDGVFSSAVIGVITAKSKDFLCVGGADEHSLFDIASVTKSIIGTTLAMQLIEQRHLALTDSVRHFLPQASDDYNDITVFHLLTHTSGLEIAMSSLSHLEVPAIVEALLHTALVVQPGTKYFYQNINTFLLCRILEIVASQPLDRLANEAIFAPLGMQETTFHPQLFSLNRYIPSEVLADGTTLQGIVQDESTRALYPTLLSGASGLFSSATDMAKYVQMLLHEGSAGKHSILLPDSLYAFTKNAIDQRVGKTALGWELEAPWMQLWPEGTFGKTGFTGCSLSVNLGKQLALVLLSNRTYPHRPENSNAIMKFRQKLHEAIMYETT